MAVKLVVTNMQAIEAKYRAGTPTIKAAIPPLVAADRARGIITTVVDMADKAQMARYAAPPVTTPSDARQSKQAIDGLSGGINPDWVMILGGPEIVPHQTLDNPVVERSDANVPSDLPYACNAPYGTEAGAFTSPTRAVGRLPDVTGLADASYLARLIAYVVSLRPTPVAEYRNYFSVSVELWRGSTRQSLEHVFGNATSMRLSPPSGPNWTRSDLAPMSHFVNCHGSSNSPTWSGEGTGVPRYPAALTAAGIAGQITPNTIATAECCYGAQLYAPPGPGVLPICNTYMLGGAAAFFGSTNIAYGPWEGQEEADLITQYVLMALLGGAAAGAAVRTARQQFVASVGPHLSPTNLKTLAQFILLGDPSIAPVRVPGPLPAGAEWEMALRDERERAELLGRSLARGVSVPERIEDAERDPQTTDALLALAEDRGLPDPQLTSYRARWRGDAEDAYAAGGELPVFHLLLQPVDAPVPSDRLLTVREQAGELVVVGESVQH